jgi:formylmethanofuran dehydrogenase subunit E
MQKSNIKNQNYISKFKNKKYLERAIDFHGHLGPYLVLGLLAGEFAIKKLKCDKYFGISVKVWGATDKPKSCLIDGLQLSTGATYGKGNIEKFNGSLIKIEIGSVHKKIALRLQDSIISRLKKAKTHKDSEILAKDLYQTDSRKIFLTHNL